MKYNILVAIAIAPLCLVTADPLPVTEAPFPTPIEKRDCATSSELIFDPIAKIYVNVIDKFRKVRHRLLPAYGPQILVRAHDKTHCVC